MTKRLATEISLLQNVPDLTGLKDIVQLTTVEERSLYLNFAEINSFSMVLKGIWVLYDEDDVMKRIEHFRWFYTAFACQERFGGGVVGSGAGTRGSTVLPISIWRYIRTFLITTDKLSPDILILYPTTFPFEPPIIRFLNRHDHLSIILNTRKHGGGNPEPDLTYRSLEGYRNGFEVSDNVSGQNTKYDLSMSIFTQSWYTPRVTVAECLLLARFVLVRGHLDHKHYSLCSICTSVETVGGTTSLLSIKGIGQTIPVSVHQSVSHYIPQCDIFDFHEAIVLKFAQLTLRMNNNLPSTTKLIAKCSPYVNPSIPPCAYDCAWDADAETKRTCSKRNCRDNWIVYVVDIAQVEVFLPRLNEIFLERSIAFGLDDCELLNSVDDLVDYVIEHDLTNKTFEELVESLVSY